MPFGFFGKRAKGERKGKGEADEVDMVDEIAFSFDIGETPEKLCVDDRYVYVLGDKSVSWWSKRDGELVGRIAGKYVNLFVMHGYVFVSYKTTAEGFMQKTENIDVFKDGEKVLTLEAPSPRIGDYENIYQLSSVYFDGRRIVGMFTFDFLKDKLGAGVGHIAVLVWGRDGNLLYHASDESCPDSNLACDGRFIYALSKVAYRIYRGLYLYDAETLERVGRYEEYEPGKILAGDKILIQSGKVLKLVGKDLRVLREVKVDTGMGGKINDVSGGSNYTVTYYGRRHREVDVYSQSLERFKIFKYKSTILTTACNGKYVYGGVKNGKIVVWKL